ncbi:CoA transferase, partial [Arenicella sp.]|nr:CoA transferase [Arenicella sp.]
EQMQHRNMVIDLKHPNGATTKGPGNPIKLSRNDNEIFTPAPTLGQDTDEVLNDILELAMDDISALKTNGVVG